MATPQNSDGQNSDGQDSDGLDPGGPAPGRTVRPGRRLLTSGVSMLLVAAALLWAASAVSWADQRYRTPFSGTRTAAFTGADLRPELVPLALATLAAVAAVLATGGWLRRVIGALVVGEGVLIAWRLAGWLSGPVVLPAPAELPRGEPLQQMTTSVLGPALMALSAVFLLVTGVLVVVGARRMPAMGSKYSAPASARRDTRDPERRLWEALDEGDDPTDGSGAGA